jgi:hypothetical protein
MGIQAARNRLTGVFEQRTEFWPQVGVMEEGLLFVANVNEGSVESGHEFDDPAQKDVADCKIAVRFLVVQFDELAILEEGYLHVGRL